MNSEFTLPDLPALSRLFWENFPEEKIFAFHGEMGAGKTTLIHALCEALQVKDAIGSPTFSIINQYAGIRGGMPISIYHMDLYRLRDEEEAARAGVEDALYSGHLCLVEWPDRAMGLFPPETIHVTIELLESGKRRLIIGRN